MKTSPFEGIQIGDYLVHSPIDEGTIGSVYLLKRIDNFPDSRAIKFVASAKIRPGWENEITKVMRLRTTDGVVKYQSHGSIEVANEKYLWISWDFIPGFSLKKCIAERKVTVPIVVDVVRRVLSVLHACAHVDIQHGDLHSGNIIVEDENPLYVDSERQRIWITDFGYCTASMGKEMLDDYLGLQRIVKDSLAAMDFHALDGPDKAIFRVLNEAFARDLHETHPTEGEWVRNPQKLLRRFERLLQGEAGQSSDTTRRIGDYLAAELIGNREEEWKDLFVPNFIGRSTLLERNICVLTGLRGCGKTMVFRRLTALFDTRLGFSSVEGADRFVGFYVNARAVAEAFPWLPEEKETEAREQIVNYFHLCWCQEILEWLREECKRREMSLGWLTSFFKQIYGDRLLLTAGEATALIHLTTFVGQELERCRLKSSYHDSVWELTDLMFLEKLAGALRNNVPAIGEKPFFFFLDDYSTPLVNAVMQRILNAIVFRRSPTVIFKVATESTESFEPVGLNRKPLEEDNDYVLIDSSGQVMQRKDEENTAFLAEILKPRLDRDPLFTGRSLDLQAILGPTPYSNNQLAEQLYAAENRREVIYQGKTVFCSLYSGNIREMISIFAEMVALEDPKQLQQSPIGGGLIRAEHQNKTLREAGGKFLSLLAAATNPSQKLFQISGKNKSFGDHLFQIADAFQSMATYELMTMQSRNEGAQPRKQARRIELRNWNEHLPDDVREYYSGIIRYGLFIRDYRGKSAGGKAVPRLVLRGLLIPYYTLTFSKRDSLTLSFEEFCDFLRRPKEFAASWQKAEHGTPRLL